jgi:hypothetical protein
LAAYQAAIAEFVSRFEAVSDLAVVRADFVQTGLGTPVAVTEGANIDVGATVVGWAEGVPGKSITSKIPGIKLSLVTDDGTLDFTSADLESYLTEFTLAGDFLISDGETWSTVYKGILDK